MADTQLVNEFAAWWNSEFTGIQCPVCSKLGIPVDQYEWPTDAGSKLPKSLQKLSHEIIGRISELNK